MGQLNEALFGSSQGIESRKRIDSLIRHREPKQTKSLEKFLERMGAAVLMKRHATPSLCEIFLTMCSPMS